MPRVYPVFYYVPANRDLRGRPMASQIHRVRSALATVGLIDWLRDRGYRYAGPLLNIPRRKRSELGIGRAEILPLFRPQDLLLLACRPPLNDDRDAGGDEGTRLQAKRSIGRVGTAFESQLLARLGAVLAYCDRRRVELRPEVPLESEQYRKVEFKQSGGASLKGGGGGTLGYVVSLPGQGGNPRVLSVWAAGGTETLWLVTLLRDWRPLGREVGAALRAASVRVIIVRFEVPTRIPNPYLQCPWPAFNPKIASLSDLPA